jgi:hypothetical protein
MTVSELNEVRTKVTVRYLKIPVHKMDVYWTGSANPLLLSLLKPLNINISVNLSM